VDDLSTTLCLIRQIAGQQKFEGLRPMREIYDLAGKCLDYAAVRSPAAVPKELLLVQAPFFLKPEKRQAIEADIRSKLAGCNLGHEVLILEGGMTVRLLGEAFDVCDPADSGGHVAEADSDPVAQGHAATQ
jgi:hypothetical protein